MKNPCFIVNKRACRGVPRTGFEPVAYGLEVRCSSVDKITLDLVLDRWLKQLLFYDLLYRNKNIQNVKSLRFYQNTSIHAMQY